MQRVLESKTNLTKFARFLSNDIIAHIDHYLPLPTLLPHPVTATTTNTNIFDFNHHTITTVTTTTTTTAIATTTTTAAAAITTSAIIAALLLFTTYCMPSVQART